MMSLVPEMNAVKISDREHDVRKRLVQRANSANRFHLDFRTRSKV